MLTVARYLQEGVGAGVRCFVNTEIGLREVESFIGLSGKIQARIVRERRYYIPLTTQPRVAVRLDSEVFLAKYDLTGLTRADVLKYAERAASIAALMPVTANTVQTVGCGIDAEKPIYGYSRSIRDDDTPNSAWIG